MERHLGLSRDPFAETADGGLYWECAPRAELRRRIGERLLRGHSIRLDGDPGSGRRSLLQQVAWDLAAQGAPVALFEEPEATTPEAFLSGLAAIVGAEPVAGADLLGGAERLYRRLVHAFCRGGPSVVVLPWLPEAPVSDEIRILAALRLLGRPLVAIAVPGPSTLPAAEFGPAAVPNFTRDDLGECLAHRCEAAGRPDLLAPAELDACVEGAPGMSAALGRARAILAARVYAAADPHADPIGNSEHSVLDPAQVREVSSLLRSLSSHTP